jgi:hypothetical protein
MPCPFDFAAWASAINRLAVFFDILRYEGKVRKF